VRTTIRCGTFLPVTPLANQTDRARARTLLALAMRRPLVPFEDIPPRVILVDFERQQLFLVEDGEATACYPVSTSPRLGGEVESHRTPPGWMRVQRRIGAGEPEGAVFDSREPTGRVWRGEASEADLILTRILTLDGLEDGVNHGPDRETLERFIYIHGTNHVGRLGEPVSHGCVRMAGSDVRELFDRVREGDPVVVIDGASALA
jgi:UDP-N-acetylmuramate--alanine ligase